jgi:hypothetical protein
MLCSSRLAEWSRSRFLNKPSLRLLTSGGSCKYSFAFSKLPGPVTPSPLVSAELRPRSQSNPRRSSWSIIIGTASVNRTNATMYRYGKRSARGRGIRKGANVGSRLARGPCKGGRHQIDPWRWLRRKHLLARCGIRSKISLCGIPNEGRALWRVPYFPWSRVCRSFSKRMPGTLRAHH